MKCLIKNQKTKIAQTTLLATLLAAGALNPAQAWAGSYEDVEAQKKAERDVEIRNAKFSGAAFVGASIAFYRGSKRLEKVSELRNHQSNADLLAQRAEAEMPKFAKAGEQAINEIGVHFSTADYRTIELSGTPERMAKELADQMAKTKVTHFFLYGYPIPALNEEPTYHSMKTTRDTYRKLSKNLTSRINDAVRAEKLEGRFWASLAGIGAMAYAGPMVFEKAKTYINDSNSIKKSAMQVSAGSAPERALDSSQAASAK